MLGQESQIDPYINGMFDIAASMDDHLFAIDQQLAMLQAERENTLRLQSEALERARSRHAQLVGEAAPTLGQVVTLAEKPVIIPAA